MRPKLCLIFSPSFRCGCAPLARTHTGLDPVLVRAKAVEYKKKEERARLRRIAEEVGVL